MIITLSIILIGFTAMASQIIYMRQLLIVFYGNELSVSFILAAWLIGGAIGSGLLGRFADKVSNKTGLFLLCQVALGIYIPSGIIAARFIKSFLHVNPGEIVPLFPIIIASFIVLAPVCIMLGFMFSLACRIQSEVGHNDRFRPGTAVGMVYILESAGAVAGGAITSLILIKLFDPIQITAMLTFLNLIAAFLIALFLPGDSKGRAVLTAIVMFFLISVTVSWFSGGLNAINSYSINKQWQGYDLIASKDSIYGNIVLVKKDEGFSFFDNGLHLYTVPDKINSEEAVHPALLEHPNPQNVLLIGGGVGALAEEILKEPVKRLDYVELDPMIITIAQNYLPDNYYKALKDKRVSIINTDGRFFVKTAKEKYDCVILRLGDPYTAQINRYYTVEFFREIKRILKEGGIISFGLTSSESYISPVLAEFLSSIYQTLKAVFSDVLVMPGETALFLASDKQGALTYDYKLLEERTGKRALDTQYVREYYLFSKLSPQKISYMKDILEKTKDVRLNYDFRPTSYYYGLIFWTTLFRESLFSKVLQCVNEHIIWQSIGIFILFLALLSTIYKRSFKRTVLVAVMTGGFSSMTFQILVLLTFQALHGYLFYKLGLILTVFMAGLAIGAFFAVKIVQKLGKERSMLIAVQGDFTLFSFILPMLFQNIGSSALFPIISLIAGFIGGAQFPLANSILAGKKNETGRVGGVTYGIDLIGSFLGAILAGVFLIPILGIPKTCFALGLINLAIAGLLILNVSVEE